MRRLTWTMVGLLLAAGVQADEINTPPRKPQIGPGMAVPEMMTVKASFKAAVKKLGKQASCQSLFQDLNLNGMQALSRTNYQQARTAKEQAICGAGIAAATGVGLSQVLICRRFHALPPLKRTAILIHEALHTAGLNEAPYDPDGMTSGEITRMVREACSL